MTKPKPAAQASAVSPAPAAPAPAEPASAPALSIDEYCTRASATDKRVEMLGAFALVERKAGRLKDTADAYAKRYQAFITQPA